MLKKLPTFRLYTVDVRLRQFRKISADGTFECVSFSSKKGERLLEELKQNGYTTGETVMNKNEFTK